MNRRLTALLIAGLASGGFAAAAPTASASDRTCVVVAGNAHLSSPIKAGVLSSNVSFAITADCENGGSISASGTLYSASCGLSDGVGTVAGGHGQFSIQTAGTVLTLRGNATGVGNAVADVRTGDSCSPTGAGADDFIVTGVINY